MSIREPVEGEKIVIKGIEFQYREKHWWSLDPMTGSLAMVSVTYLESLAQDTDWAQQRKIAQMPGTKRTAVNALASTLEKALAGRIKSVYIGIQWDDDTFVGDWSNMTRSELCTHAVMAQATAAKEIDEGN